MSGSDSRTLKELMAARRLVFADEPEEGRITLTPLTEDYIQHLFPSEKDSPSLIESSGEKAPLTIELVPETCCILRGI